MQHKRVIARERKLALLLARGVHAVYKPARNPQNQQQVKLAVTATQVRAPEQSLAILQMEHGHQARGEHALVAAFAWQVPHKLAATEGHKHVLPLVHGELVPVIALRGQQRL